MNAQAKPEEGKKVEDTSPLFPRKARQYTPTYFETIRWDPMLHQPKEWREAQIRDQARWSRKYLLPTVKVLCLSLIFVVRLIKRVVPFRLYSWKILNSVSQWFVKRCMSAEAQEVLLRHFATEAIVVNFIAQNTGGEAVEDVGLFPVRPEDLGDWGGMNATLLHDCNIMNLFIDLGKSEQAKLFTKKKKSDFDFSSLRLPEFKINPDPKSRLMNLDMETSLYLMVLFLVLMFDEDVAENAANSLRLDESVLAILGNLTGDPQYRHWSTSPFTNHVIWPKDAPKALHEHILIFEYIYVRLCLFRDGKKDPMNANV